MLSINIDHSLIFRQFIESQRKEIDALNDKIFELKRDSYQNEGRVLALRDYVKYLEGMLDNRNEIIQSITSKTLTGEICQSTPK